jgi:hypothetical protein
MAKLPASGTQTTTTKEFPYRNQNWVTKTVARSQHMELNKYSCAKVDGKRPLGRPKRGWQKHYNES